MKRNPAVLLLFFCAVTSFAQPSCNVLSLGQFFEKLKNLKPITHDLFVYKTYKSFDFETFKPSGDSTNFQSVKVGCSKTGDIREIIFNGPEGSYSLLVYNFEDYRILLLKRRTGLDKFLYTPTAIYNSKKSDENYMINVKAQFKNNYDALDLFDYFPIGEFSDISCLMRLDKDLYPREIVKFSNSRIVQYSGLKYEFEKSHKLELEVVHLFIGAEHDHADLRINEKSCMQEIMNRTISLRVKSNLIIFSRPSVFKEIQAPLWIFSGAHRYDLSEKQ